MSNEINIAAKCTVVNGYFKSSFDPGTLLFTQDASGAYEATLDIGTSEEDVTPTDVTTPGWVVLQNLDTSNYVEWGPKSGGAMVLLGRLEPREIAIFRMSPTGPPTLRMKANNATCKVMVKVFRD